MNSTQTKIDIKEVLHLYLGCEIQVVRPEGSVPFESGLKGGCYNATEALEYDTTYTLDARKLAFIMGSTTVMAMLPHVKPILRPLESMTEEELDEIARQVLEEDDLAHPVAEKIANYETFISMGDWSAFEMAQMTAYLLSKHFDLFGLIPAGLAIDKASLNPKSI